MARLEYHTLKSSPFTNTRSKLIAMEIPIVFAIRCDIRFCTKLRITLGLTMRKCPFGFDNHYYVYTDFLQDFVASISAHETQPEASSPMDRGGKALHALTRTGSAANS